MQNKIFFCGFVLFFGVSCSTERGELGSQHNPIKFYFTPSSDANTIIDNTTEMMEYLEKETGYYFESAVPTNYITVVEAFGSGRADVAIINSFGYLLTHKKYEAFPRLKIIRYGSPTYRGQIIAHVESGIEQIKDIDNRKFAFTDASSTSGYLFPLKVLNDAGVTPSQQVFAMKHDNVVTMVYQNQVDAGATFYSEPSDDGTINDARARVKTQFPDVEEKVKIIALTDPIPNDPVVFRKGMPEKMVASIAEALKKFAETEEGKKLMSFYSIDGFIETDDSDYDVLREMIKSTGVEAQSLVQ